MVCRNTREERKQERRTQDNREVPVSPEKAAYGLGFLATWAMREDKLLPKEKVEQYWSDEFLTNVISPILDHIRKYKWRQYYRLLNNPRDPYTGRVKEWEIETLKEDAIAVQRTMTILREWRG